MNSRTNPESSPMPPRRIAFFIFPDVEEQDFVGPWECFGLWHLEANGPEIFTVAKNVAPLRCVHGLKVTPDYSFSTCPPFDTIVIPGGKGRHHVIACEESVRFLKESCGHAQDILTVCTGSLILNSLNLLDGKQATTHWEFLNELKRNSSVTVMAGQRFVRDGNLWTAAGVFSGVDLALAYIDSFTGSVTPNGSLREGDAGTVQAFSEYLPDQRVYHPTMDLSEAPTHIRMVFS